MFARISLSVLLLVSLLFAGFAAPARCLEKACMMSCCTATTCCESAPQQEAPRLPESTVARPEMQLALPDFQVAAMLYVRPPETRDFIRADERSGGHAPPPLARSCIQLI